MAKIHSLKIENYRGIKDFEQSFDSKSLICLIGRGDSGKTTVLNAISAALTPSWDYKFYDSDFYNVEIDSSIIIEVSLFDLPDELMTDSKFGLHKRLLTKDNLISDDLDVEGDDLLTIRLRVDKNLEPIWKVVNGRENQQNIEIRASDRSKLNVFIVSDYIDRHFTWGKGTPLYSLLKKDDNDIDTILIEAHREAHKKTKSIVSVTDNFKTVVDSIKEYASGIGLSVSELDTYIDFINLLMREGSIALHDDIGIPYRLKGKGTKRLLSIAIQMEVAKQGGIILIDEVEQGLEPDRVKYLVNQLKKNSNGQVFITTHSNNVIVELDAQDIYLKKNDNKELFHFKEDDFQQILRINPNAFFSKRVLVCEGATEVGVCRAINNHRVAQNKENLEMLGISLVDGKGDSFVQYSKLLKSAGYDACVFCDSDKESINIQKSTLLNAGIKVIDCDEGNSIEEQIFNDTPWETIEALVDYAINLKGEESILHQLSLKSKEELKDSKNTRVLLGQKSNKKVWFKRIEYGQRVGEIFLEQIDDITDSTLGNQYNELMKWIDKI